MSDSHIEIDGGEVVDISSNATTPEALRRAAAYLRRQSEKPPDLDRGDPDAGAGNIGASAGNEQRYRSSNWQDLPGPGQMRSPGTKGIGRW
jgi:hypothetical protein